MRLIKNTAISKPKDYLKLSNRGQGQLYPIIIAWGNFHLKLGKMTRFLKENNSIRMEEKKDRSMEQKSPQENTGK